MPDSHRHSPASTNDLVVATDACDFPLTLHHLLHSALTCSPEREIREAADGGRINRWAVPDRIVFVDSLDKTSVGKIDKKRLRVRYANPGSVR